MWKNVFVWALILESGCMICSVKVSVYYEALCPYSADFLVNQFYPSYQRHAGDIQVNLVPYGEATTTNESGFWTFECEHGPAECYGNKVHSCAVELYPINQSIEFVVCSMNTTNASSDVNLELCASSSNISWSLLKDCINSSQGDELLAANGKTTDKEIPEFIDSVPIILFNDVFDEEIRILTETNFENIFDCFSEPNHCKYCNLSKATVLRGFGNFLSLPLFLLISQMLFVF